MLPKKLVEQYASGLDVRKSITTDNSGTHSTTLTPYERLVEVNSALGVGTVRLPDVGSCEGLEFWIEATTGNTQTVTVKEYATGNSLDWPGDASLNAAYDRAGYKSDGKRWWKISDQYT